MEHHLYERAASLCMLCRTPWPCWGYARDLEVQARRVIKSTTSSYAGGVYVDEEEVERLQAVLDRGQPDR